MRVGGLQVERYGVVDTALDACPGEALAHRVAEGSVAPDQAHDVEVKHGSDIVACAYRAHPRYSLKHTCVALGGRSPRLVPAGQTSQLHAQQRRLQVVQPVTVTDQGVGVLVGLAVVAQQAQTLGQLGASGGDRAAVAERPRFLPG